MDHIQYQTLEFVAVGSLRLYRFSVLIQIRDLLLYDVQGHFLRHDLLQILHLEQIIQDHTIIIRGFSLLILSIHQFIGQFIIFYDRRSAIL